MDLKKAYRNYKVPMDRYLWFYIVPVLLVTILGLYWFYTIYPFLTLTPLYMIVGLGAVIDLYVILHPIIVWEKRGRDIDEEMHLFITRMGVVTSTEIPRMTFVEMLHSMAEYDEMGVEIRKIFVLVKTWRLTLAIACRQIATGTPSKMLADFLERFAFSIEGGETVTQFFIHEQDVVLDQYTIRYEGTLKDMEFMKEIFVAMITASMFVIAIVAFIPILTGKSVVSLMALAIFLFTVIEIGFAYVVYSAMPREHVWQRTGMKNKMEVRVQKSMALSLIGVLIMAAIVTAVALSDMGESLGMNHRFAWPFMVAIVITPLAFPGYIALIEEEKIRRRDDSFPAFMRTLGSTTEARSIAAVTAVKKLARHDFGPLTENIKALSKRLATGIDAKVSWLYFGSETGSDLISKFSEMYVEGFRAGGRSRDMTNLISRNFVRVLGLRKKRYQAAGDMTGLLYGVMIAIAFALYITVEVLDKVQSIYSEITLPGGPETVTVLEQSFFDVRIMALIILTLIVSHAFISALLVRIMGGGHKAGSLIHFVGLVWLAAFLSYIVAVMINILVPGV